MCSQADTDNNINPRPTDCRVTVLRDSPPHAFVDLQLAVHSGTEVTEKRKKKNCLPLNGDTHKQEAGNLWRMIFGCFNDE